MVYSGEGEKYGFLEIGWGSCSGCDAMMACENYEEMDELIDTLEKSIDWFNKKSLKEYMDDRDWKGQWDWGFGLEIFVKEVYFFLNK